MTTLSLIDVLKMIEDKFKSLEVKCLKFEEYLEDSLYKFIDSMQKEEDINHMLLYKNAFNKDAL
jgi:hypothetical protein